MSGVRRKNRKVESAILSLLESEEEPKSKDSRLENGTPRTRRSSRSRITDYFPPSSIPSDVIDDIIQDAEEDEEVPSEGGSSSGKENDSNSEINGLNTGSFVPVISTRSKTILNKMPLTTFAVNVSPPPSPSKLVGSSPASSPPTPHKIKLMSKPAYNNLKISLTPKKPTTTAECSTPLSDVQEETNNNNSSLSKDFTVAKSLDANPEGKSQNLKKSKNKVVSTKKKTTPTTPLKKTNTAKNNSSAKNGSHKVTEYFPIRRSSRKSKKELDKQYTAEIEDILRSSTDDHLDLGIAYYSLKGRGVQAMRNFSKGEFVVEYAGDLVEVDIAKEREFQYSKDHTTGCYMYYFKHNGKQYCVDATKDSGRLGRLVNHSRLHPNLLTKVVIFENKPRLILVARQDIEKYSELLYDYGDRSKESLLAHPWLAL